MSPLSILVTADPQIPVPPRLYGGIERVIALLIDGLVARGHTVALVAHRDSEVPCDLVPYATQGGSPRECVSQAAAIARETLRRRPDVVQSFSRLASLAPILPWRVPKVMSYQREITPRTVRWASRLAAGSLSFTGCSRRLTLPVANLADWEVVYNAVPIDRYRFSQSVAHDAPLVFLGRVEAIKGPQLAIAVAKQCNRRLLIAGNVPAEPKHQEFFQKEIEPFVDGSLITYVGPVDDDAKSTLLSGAAALLMPVLWDEPFGIVMAEALACGTPVIGLDRGAIPEVVLDGRTGFVCHDTAEMTAAVHRLDGIDRAACRRDAETRFSRTALVDRYEAIYQRLRTRFSLSAASA